MQTRNKGSLFIVSAPSGAGKTTLCRKLTETFPGLKFSVSYTTRKPRNGEKDNIDYTFINREEFMAKVLRDEFLEWAEVHGELYGTSRERIETLITVGFDVILDIDTQGAMQLKQRHESGVFVFILPPSAEALRKRLVCRMTDSEDEIRRRMKRAVDEIRTYTEYDYVIINDMLENSVREFEAIIVSHRARKENINHLWVQKMFLDQEVN